LKCSSSIPILNLIVTGTSPAAFTAEPTIDASSRGLAGMAAPPPEVEVVDPPLVDETPHRLTDKVRINSVELEAAWAFVGSEVRQLEGLFATLDKRSGSDHLADIQPGPESAAECPKGVIGDAGHRRQDNRRRNLDRPDMDGWGSHHTEDK
jgi:hypothetical protein